MTSFPCNASVAAAGSMYQWTLGNGGTSSLPNFSYTYTTPGTYNISLTITTPSNCTNSLTVQQVVEVYPLPVADFDMSNQVLDIMDPTVDLNNLSYDAFAWLWDFGDYSIDSSLYSPSHVYGDTGTYTIMLVVETANGCLDTTYRRIKVKAESSLFVPSSFTPNGDGKNDKFTAFGSWIKDFDMVILDRWGAVIYHTTSLSKPWDGSYENNGSMCQSDVYIYKITAKGSDNKTHQFIGRVTLWR